MKREELRSLILRWCVARGYQPRLSGSYGGAFFAARVGVRPWDVSNVVRGEWACVREMRTPVKMAAALKLDLREVWPVEAGVLPGLREVPDPPHLVRPCTIGIGFDIAAPPAAGDEPEELRQLLAHLPERQQSVLSLRFGLDGPEMPLEVLGVMLGCTRERVRQIEVQALQRLRRLLGGPPVPRCGEPRARMAPWRDGRADRHYAQSSPEGQAVELERAVDRARSEQRRARAGNARRRAGTRESS